MTIKVEKFISDGKNLVFKTELLPEDGKYEVRLKDNSLLSYESLGEGYILITDNVPKDKEIFISYTVEGDVKDNIPLEENLLKRVRDLEATVLELYKTNQLLTEALNNRVSVGTFQAWTRLIEKKTGITLVGSPLGTINQELYKNKA